MRGVAGFAIHCFGKRFCTSFFPCQMVFGCFSQSTGQLFPTFCRPFRWLIGWESFDVSCKSLVSASLASPLMTLVCKPSVLTACMNFFVVYLFSFVFCGRDARDDCYNSENTEERSQFTNHDDAPSVIDIYGSLWIVPLLGIGEKERKLIRKCLAREKN